MALVDDYYAAIRNGSTGEANYLAQMLAANAGININANQVTAIPASMIPQATTPSPSPSFSSGLNAIVQGFMHPLDTLSGNNKAAMNASATSGSGGVGDAVSGFVGGLTGAASGTAKALGFITDLPRVATTLLGLIVLIAGIFALSKGPAIQVVGSIAKKNLTS